MKDYIPQTDGNFNSWQNAYINFAVANAGLLELTPAQILELQNAQTEWVNAYTNHLSAQATAKRLTHIKNQQLKNLKQTIRKITRQIQANPDITNSQRANLGIRIRDTKRTPLSDEIILKTKSPIIEPKCIAPKIVRIDWYPSSVDNDRRGLPDGIDGIIIWVATSCENPKYEFLTMDTASPYIHNVENDDTVTLLYRAQWFDKRKRRGPFSNVVKVAVTA